jgi:hypothetical protein
LFTQDLQRRFQPPDNRRTGVTRRKILNLVINKEYCYYHSFVGDEPFFEKVSEPEVLHEKPHSEVLDSRKIKTFFKVFGKKGHLEK